MDQGHSGPTAGMGPVAHGPDFVSPSVPAKPAAAVEPTRPTAPIRYTRRSAALPWLLTIALVALVVAVVAAASVVAYRADTRPAAESTPLNPAPPRSAPSRSDDRIDFATRDGAGTLILRSSRWLVDSTQPRRYQSYLRVEIELVCTSGELGYDPFDFQAFDRTGRLFDVSIDSAGTGLLSSGVLDPGEQVRGTLAFQLSRRPVTLLMTESADKTLIALKVPD